MTDEAPAILGVAALVIDCADPSRLAEWWSRLIGGDVEVDADGDARLRTPFGVPIDFLKVPERKVVKNRLHIDLRAVDLALATEQALRMGAVLADDVYLGESWRVLRDPEGNEFCLLAPPP